MPQVLVSLFFIGTTDSLQTHHRFTTDSQSEGKCTSEQARPCDDRLYTICTCRRTRHCPSCPVVMLLARPVLTVAAASVAATNFGSGWQNGICGTTTQFEGTRCRVSEKQGSWVAASRKYCAALCVACSRCHYVSYSKADNDCFWFRTCDFHKSPRSCGRMVNISW